MKIQAKMRTHSRVYKSCARMVRMNVQYKIRSAAVLLQV